jgi:hypothetical protein
VVEIDFLLVLYFLLVFEKILKEKAKWQVSLFVFFNLEENRLEI